MAENCMTRNGVVKHGTKRHDTAQRDTKWSGVAKLSMVRHDTAQHRATGKEQHGTKRYIMARSCMTRYGAVRLGTEPQDAVGSGTKWHGVARHGIT